MRSGFGPRFVVEAIFLVTVATVAALAQFRTEAIVLVMVLAWVLVAAVEWALARSRRGDDAPGDDVDGDAQHVHVLPRDPEPTAQPVIERRVEQTPEPELDAPPAPEPVPPVDSARAEPTPSVELGAAAEPRVAADEPIDVEQDEAPSAETAAGEQQEQVEPERGQPPAEEQEHASEERQDASSEPALEPEPEPVPPHEPEPAPEREAVPLAAVPDVEGPAEPEPAPRAEGVIALPLPQSPREWNLWELDRLVRARAGVDAERYAEWSYLLMYLRDFASPEGTLPVDFDPLVRESFGELLETR